MRPVAKYWHAKAAEAHHESVRKIICPVCAKGLTHVGSRCPEFVCGVCEEVVRGGARDAHHESVRRIRAGGDHAHNTVEARKRGTDYDPQCAVCRQTFVCGVCEEVVKHV